MTKSHDGWELSWTMDVTNNGVEPLVDGILADLLLTVRISQQAYSSMREACWKAGDCEVGGLLLAEHVGENEFRVLEATADEPGSPISFTRSVEHAARALESFHDLTNHNYTRYNYLGEWHSHPISALSPSDKDDDTMFDLLGNTVAEFIVSLIVRQDFYHLTCAGYVCFPPSSREPVRLVLD